MRLASNGRRLTGSWGNLILQLGRRPRVLDGVRVLIQSATTKLCIRVPKLLAWCDIALNYNWFCLFAIHELLKHCCLLLTILSDHATWIVAQGASKVCGHGLDVTLDIGKLAGWRSAKQIQRFVCVLWAIRSIKLLSVVLDWLSNLNDLLNVSLRLLSI